MDEVGGKAHTDAENRWPSISRVNKMEESEGVYEYDSIDEGDSWINEVDVSRFATEINPELRNYSRNNVNERTKVIGSYPKPSWSYSCLIALALKDSATGRMTVSEIYAFMCEHFPYFRTAPSGWKNSVRHNLSLNKCFEKIEVENDAHGRKSCLWSIRAEKMDKMEMDIKKSKERDLSALAEGAVKNDQIMVGEGCRKEVLSAHDSRQTGELKFPVQYTVKTEVIDDSSVKTPSLNPRVNIPAILNRYAPKRNSVTSVSRGSGESCLSAVQSPHPSTLSSSLPSTLPSTLHCTLSSTLSSTFHPTPPSTTSSLIPCQPCQPLTPLKKFRVEPFHSSPLSHLPLSSDYDTASAALTDNSLLITALDQSPYRGPTTFPTLSR